MIGDQFDHSIYNYIISIHLKPHTTLLDEAVKKVGKGVTSNQKSINKIKTAVTSCKEKLSASTTSDVSYLGLHDMV